MVNALWRRRFTSGDGKPVLFTGPADFPPCQTQDDLADNDTPFQKMYVVWTPCTRRSSTTAGVDIQQRPRKTMVTDEVIYWWNSIGCRKDAIATGTATTSTGYNV